MSQISKITNQTNRLQNKLPGVLAKLNSPFTAKDLQKIASDTFGQKFNEIQYGLLLSQIDHELMPLVKTTFWLLEGEKRKGRVELVLRFCRQHHSTWTVNDIKANETVRKEYFRILERNFPLLSHLSSKNTTDLTRTEPILKLALTKTFSSRMLDFRIDDQTRSFDEYIDAAERVWRGLIEKGLFALIHFNFFELADLTGATEIQDPLFASLSRGFIFSISPKAYQAIERDRKAFQKRKGIARKLTSKDLTSEIPNLNYIAPENRHFPHLANLHPEITRPGIYYHRELAKRFPNLEAFKIMIIFHELFEQELALDDLIDKDFKHYFRHTHPMIIISEVFVSALFGENILRETINRYRGQINDVKPLLQPINLDSDQHYGILLSNPIYDKSAKIHARSIKADNRHRVKVLKMIKEMESILEMMESPQFLDNLRKVLRKKGMLPNSPTIKQIGCGEDAD